MNDNEPFDKEIAHRMELIRNGLKNSSSIAKLNQIGSSKPYPSSLKLYLEGAILDPLDQKASDHSYYENEKRMRTQLDSSNNQNAQSSNTSSLSTSRKINPTPVEQISRLEQSVSQKPSIYVQQIDRGGETSRSQYSESLIGNSFLSPASYTYQREM